MSQSLFQTLRRALLSEQVSAPQALLRACSHPPETSCPPEQEDALGAAFTQRLEQTLGYNSCDGGVPVIPAIQWQQEPNDSVPVFLSLA